MTGLELARAGGPEAFTGVVLIPDVEVADLWSLWSRDAHDLTCAYFERYAGAWGTMEARHLDPGAGGVGGGSDACV